MKNYLFSLIILLCAFSSGQVLGQLQKKLKKGSFTEKEKQEILQQLDSFYDPNEDYSKFTGRITDRDRTSNIFKVTSENKNIKFYRSGDRLRFHVARKDENDLCEGFVRSVEPDYFVMYVKDLSPCWEGERYFRRGTMLVFNSGQLAERIREASLYRVILLRRRKDFFKQLNGINHFLWSYDQQKVLTASDYDKKIVALEKAKQKAMEHLVEKKRDSMSLQKELMFRLDQLDKDLDFYRIDKSDLMVDRWHLDHHLGLPVGKRPQPLKQSSR